MARGRFVVLTDEHVPYTLVEALRNAGWVVYRVEDEPALGKRTPDPIVFAYAAERRWVWLSRDQAAVVHPSPGCGRAGHSRACSSGLSATTG